MTVRAGIPSILSKYIDNHLFKEKNDNPNPYPRYCPRTLCRACPQVGFLLRAGLDLNLLRLKKRDLP